VLAWAGWPGAGAAALRDRVVFLPGCAEDQEAGVAHLDARWRLLTGPALALEQGYDGLDRL